VPHEVERPLPRETRLGLDGEFVVDGLEAVAYRVELLDLEDRLRSRTTHVPGSEEWIWSVQGEWPERNDGD
jgi:hypothetical protein